VQCDLHRGLKNPSKGRHGLTARQVVGALVLMRIKNWDYRELRERIADGVTLRQFADFHCDKVPKHDAFNRGINRLTPETLKDINDIFVGVAVELGFEEALSRSRCRALRIVCWRRGARQQSHEHRRAVDQTRPAPSEAIDNHGSFVPMNRT
jgi:hypothetical protein